MNFIKESNRIYAEDSNGMVIAEVTFPRVSEQVVDINHTFVDNSLRGQGIADLLLKETVVLLQEKGLKAQLSCSYAIKWFEKHPELSGLLKQ